MAMMRAAAPSTYILAPRSETPPSGTPTLYLYHYLHHHHLFFYPLLTVEQMFLRLRYRLRRGCALLPSMDPSDTTHSKVRALWTIVLEEPTEIGDLRAADRIRQTQLTKALTLLKTLQTQMAALQSQQRPARDPTHPDVPKEAGIFDEELEAPMEDQPLPADASPTTLSPDYIADSNPEEDDDHPKEDPTDYPMILSPQAEDTEAVKTDESASTPPTPYHLFAAALPSSSLPPSISPLPENIKSLKDNIRD
ncbi:hypothetical protein Tco_0848488 [Tanacetum coccineum]